MRSVFALGVALCLVIVMLGLRAPLSVEERLDAVRKQFTADQTFWGIYVQEVASGRVLAAQHAHQGLLPASVQKLLTTAAALDLLGPEFRYQTVLYLNGSIESGVLRGDLILRGSGDPTFGSPSWDGPDPLRQWAQELAKQGITRIQGRIIGDDNVFDNRPYADGWDVDYLTSQFTHGLGFAVSGLSYHDNYVVVRVAATQPGAPPRVRQEPMAYLHLENRAVTAARRYGEALGMERAFGSESLRLYGTVPVGYQRTLELPVANPTRYTLEAFRQYLVAEGIRVEADLVDVDDLPSPPRYDRAQPLLVHTSAPLEEIVRLINRRSHNFYAEQLFRTLSPDGTAEGAARRIQAFLRRQGIDTQGLSIRDGSGLSRKNLVPPVVLGELLRAMHHHPAREVFLTSLPQGGERRSTLEVRLHNVPVRAKTGSLMHVRTLCGYTTTADGRMVAFALMANNYTLPAPRVVHAIDQMVRALHASP